MKTQRGFTLLFAVVATSLLMGVTLGILNLTTKQLILSSVGRDSQLAFYAADSGAECARYWDLRSNAFTPDATTTIHCNGQDFIVGGSATTQFTYKLSPSDAQSAEVTVVATRNGATGVTTIRSYGHNVPVSTNNPRIVERAVKIDYTRSPDPSKSLSCAPANQTVQRGGVANFTANLIPNDSSAQYAWTVSGGLPGGGPSKNFSAQFSSNGTYTVTVATGSLTAQCTVNVTDDGGGGGDPGDNCTPNSDFVLALDGSGSIMGWGGVPRYWETVKQNGVSLIDGIGKVGSMRFGAEWFNSETHELWYVTSDLNQVKARITNNANPPANSATNIGLAVDHAVSLLQAASGSHPKAIIAITDGVPHIEGMTEAQAKADSIAKAQTAKNAGIKVFTIGLLKQGDSGYDSAKEFLQSVSSGTGYFYNTNDYNPNDPADGLNKVVAALSCPTN